MSDTFRLLIYAADHPFFEGECRSAVVPTLWGQQGVMAHHSNYISAIVPGWVKVRSAEEKELLCAVSEGLLKVENNDVVILVATAEYPEEIDENRARRAAEAAAEATTAGAVRAAEAEAAPRRAAAADSGGVKCSTELNSIGL